MDRKEYRRAYYLAHREKLIAQTRAHQLAHVEERKEYMRKYAEEHRDELATYKQVAGKVARDAEHEKVFDLLGSVCVRCGFSDKRALNVDHINGGGHQHRLAVGSSSYWRVILTDPEAHTKYQILCSNCNQIKRIENHECRGKTKK